MHSPIRILLLALLALAAMPGRAAPPQVQVVTIAELSARLALTKGDVWVQFTSTDSNCGYCTQSNPVVDRIVAAGESASTVLRVQWSPWRDFPASLSTLPLKGNLEGVPTLVLFHDGKESQRLLGSDPNVVAALTIALHSSYGAPPVAPVASTPAAAPGGAAPPPVPVTTSAVPVDSLVLAPATVRKLWGASVDLRVTAKDAKGAVIPPPSVTFTSSAPAIASVDAAGRVNLLRRGHADITVSASGKTASTSIDVEGFAKLGRTSAQSPCALPDDRQQIYCWGEGYYKIPLGRARVSELKAPTAIAMGTIPAGTKIASIADGPFTTCALSDDGRVFCWGQLPYGSLGRALPPNPAGSASGTTPAEIDRGEVPAGVKFTAVAVGPDYACAAGDNHQLYCWGSAARVPLQATPRPASAIQTPVAVPRGEIPTGAAITGLALSTNGGCVLAGGDVYCWHNAGFKGPVRVLNGEHGSGSFVDLDSDDFTCALTHDGAAYCTGAAQGWRFGAGGQAFVQATDWRAVSRPGPGGFKVFSQGGVAASTCAIDPAGALWCWGDAYLGSAADGNLAKHTVSRPSPTLRGEIPDGTTLVDVSCGKYHCIALGSDGRHYGWGSNEKSVLGRDAPGGSAVPVLGRPPAQ